MAKLPGQEELKPIALQNDLSMTVVQKLLWKYSGFQVNDSHIDLKYRRIAEPSKEPPGEPLEEGEQTFRE